MKHLKQTDNYSCTLYALAMVLDTSREALEEELEEKCDCSDYSTLTLNRGNWIETLNRLFSWFRPPNHLPDRGIRVRKKDLCGRGLLSLMDRPHAHSVAFEDGIIYDPEEDYSIPFRQYFKLQRSRGWKPYYLAHKP